jgi:hypothetical protein
VWYMLNLFIKLMMDTEEKRPLLDGASIAL